LLFHEEAKKITVPKETFNHIITGLPPKEYDMQVGGIEVSSYDLSRLAGERLQPTQLW